jgi:hypothetical protein
MAVVTLKNGQAVVSAANAARDGTGTLVTLYTAGTSGALIPRVMAAHQGAAGAASTAMSLRLFRVNSGATVKTLISEVLLPTATPAAGTALGSSVTFPKTNITLASGEALAVAQTAAESVAYDCDQGGDY